MNSNSIVNLQIFFLKMFGFNSSMVNNQVYNQFVHLVNKIHLVFVKITTYVFNIDLPK